jgi:hypothetical protein
MLLHFVNAKLSSIVDSKTVSLGNLIVFDGLVIRTYCVSVHRSLCCDFLFAEDSLYLGERLCSFELDNSRQFAKHALVIQSMSALCPTRLSNQSHYRVVMNRLAREGRATDEVADSVELGGNFQRAVFDFRLFH